MWISCQIQSYNYYQFNKVKKNTCYTIKIETINKYLERSNLVSSLSCMDGEKSSVLADFRITSVLLTWVLGRLIEPQLTRKVCYLLTSNAKFSQTLTFSDEHIKLFKFYTDRIEEIKILMQK